MSNPFPKGTLDPIKLLRKKKKDLKDKISQLQE